MDVLWALLRGLRLLLDLLLLVLDLNFFLVSSLLSAFLWLLAAVSGLPAAAAASALACWDGLLLALLRAGCGALEALRAAGQAALRGRELAQRGLGAVLGGGQALGRQLGEALAIGGSLLMYLANSLLNLCLLGAQDLLTLLAALWDSLAGPAVRLGELAAAGLAHVASGAVALAILLWSPCQAAFEALCSAADLFVGVFFVNVYGLALLLLVVAAGALALNPGLLWTLMGYLLGYLHTLPSARRLRGDARRLYQVAVLSLGVALSWQPWRGLADWTAQVTDWSLRVTGRSRGARPGNRASERRRVVANPRAGEQQQQERPEEEQGTGQRAHTAGTEEPGASRWKIPGKRRPNPDGDDDPWALLKEQEERKKCVICQDQTKTVLLLPCRHLCLCQECTEVLLQQDIYQRNCPLCRQVILQTLNVYL